MAGKGNLPLSVTLSLVDKATGPLRSFSSTVKNAVKPFTAIKNNLKLTSNELGIPRLGKAFSGVGRAAGGVLKEVKALGKEVVLLGGIATAALGGIVYTTANAGDAAFKSAQKVGIATESWSRLKYAADMSNVSAEKLQSGLIRLNDQAVKAARGGKEAQFWFKQFGISIRDNDGKLKASDFLLAEAAEKLAGMEDGAHKTALAVGMFGKSLGPELIPLLNAGRDGLDEYAEEAERAGVVFSDSQGSASASFNDALTRIQTAIKGITYAIGNELIPALTPLLGWIQELIVANRELISGQVREWMGRIQAVLPDLQNALARVWDMTKGFLAVVNSLVESLGGWGEVIPYIVAGLAAFKLAPLVMSVITLTKAVAGLGVALLTTPIGWVVLGIAGLVAGFTFLWRNCEGFRDFWYGLWEGINTVAGTVFDHLAGIFGRIQDAFKTGLVGGLSAILLEFNPLYFFANAFNAVLEYLSGFSLADVGASIIGSLWTGLQDMWDGVVGWIHETISDLTGWMPDWVKDKLGLNFTLPDKPSSPPQRGFGPPAGVDHMIREETAQQREVTTTAKVEVIFTNVPPDVHIKPDRGVTTRVQRNDDPYSGVRMGY